MISRNSLTSALQALGSFLGFLVSSFGYSQRQSLLISMPVSAIALVSMVSSGVLGSIFPRRRILIAMLFLLPGIVGYSLLWKGDRDKAMLLGGLYIVRAEMPCIVHD